MSYLHLLLSANIRILPIEGNLWGFDEKLVEANGKATNGVSPPQKCSIRKKTFALNEKLRSKDRALILNEDIKIKAARALVLLTNVKFLSQPEGFFCLLLHLFIQLLKTSFGA